MQSVVDPVLTGMRAEGDALPGVPLLRSDAHRQGPKVVEFNVRFGDPEAQVVMPLSRGPLAPWRGRGLGPDSDRELPRRPTGVRVGVVLASGGYPGRDARLGTPDHGLAEAVALEGCAGVPRRARPPAMARLVTAGGRVLTVVGPADLREARDRAYRRRAYLVQGHALPDGHRAGQLASHV